MDAPVDHAADPAADHAADLSLDQLVELECRDAERRAADEASGIGIGGGGGDHDSDGTIVLPWWQHPLNILTMVVTAALLAAMIGWMIGDSGATPPHDAVDTGFLQDMREHHEQAVLMGFVYRGLPDTSPGLRTVATSIVRGQSIEVGRMIQLLRDFDENEANESDTSMGWMGTEMPRGTMPGMATDDQLDSLGRSSGAEADAMFVELMTAHHHAGIDMAEYAATHAANAEVEAMAASMAEGQRSEITELRNELG